MGVAGLGDTVKPGGECLHAIEPQAGFAGELEDEVGVLAGGVDGEVGRAQGAPFNEVGLDAQEGQVQAAAVEHLEELGRGHTDRLRQGDDLAGGVGHGDDPGVDDQLEAGRGGGGTVLAGPHSARPDGVQDRSDQLTAGGRTGGHDDKGAGLSGLAGPGDGRVVEEDPGGLRDGGQAGHIIRADSGHLQPGGAGAHGGSGLAHDLGDGGAVEEHGDDDVGPLDGGGGGGGDLDAVVGQGLGTRDRAVPGAHGVAGAGDVASHRRAHNSGTEYGYGQLRHASPLILSDRACRPVRGRPPAWTPYGAQDRECCRPLYTTGTRVTRKPGRRRSCTGRRPGGRQKQS